MGPRGLWYVVTLDQIVAMLVHQEAHFKKNKRQNKFLANLKRLRGKSGFVESLPNKDVFHSPPSINHKLSDRSLV